MLSMVRGERLLELWTALLLNRQVVLFGGCKALLTGCVLALVHLLKPFQWLFPVVTCLPQGLFSMMDAPLPFLFGLQADHDSLDSQAVFTSYPKVYFFSLDSNTLFCSEKKRQRLSEQMPLLGGLRE